MGLLFFVALLGYAMLAGIIFPKIKPGTALFSSLLFMMSLSYIAVILFGFYRLFPHLLIYGGALLVPALFIYGIIRKEKPLIVCSFEFVIFGAASAGLVMLLGDGVLIAHDNYSFWARAVRELYLFKDFYINYNSNIAHNDYNPIMAFKILLLDSKSFPTAFYTLYRVIWKSAGRNAFVVKKRLPLREEAFNLNIIK